MQIIDIVVSRESKNSPWVNVVFLGDDGESVSVRLACAIPSGSDVGRNYIIRRATTLLRSLVTCEAFNTLGETVWVPRTGRFGTASEAPRALRQVAESWTGTGEE
ncbi:hypothetical protein [Chelativorans sp. AA-79]|uniref:hypothetical protein n=1 Tax=Chelativorans sp. AA-79 TaxID=3028735 RepID=UPI0023F979B2|nr:hypothetical protein [Chelativorans sp. AA-79]WEX07104.1 hypothetical protein PVE73_13235 [Chelativorans sp. AA-79]